MARTSDKPRDKQTGAKNEGSSNGGETISGYFRQILTGNRKLLNSRSNQALLERWAADHPGQPVSDKVKQGLSNVKSILRKKLRRRRKKGEGEQPAAAETPTPRPAPKPARGLEALEEQVDECLSLAKHLDREGLAQVIHLLRRARNEVVWKLGEP